MEWFEQACTVICTIISSLQTIITASLSTPCQSKPVSVPVKCHMNRVEMMILHQNRVILGIVFHPVYLFVPNFPNLTNINVILIMMITINCFWWLKKKLVSHWMNTHEGYTFCRCLCAYFASLLFFQNKPKYRYSMNASDGQGQNRSGFGFCVNSTSDSILSNSAYLSEKNTLHVHSFKNK